jgi:hypothetical protein
MLFILLTIILSYLYMFLRSTSPAFMDVAILPALIWTLSLAALEMFIVMAPFGIVAGLPMLILMWKVIYTWISYVSDKSGNKNLKKQFDNFQKMLLTPVRAIVSLWNAIVNGLSSWFRVVTENWNNMTKLYKETLNLISNSFKFLAEQVTKLWTELVIAFKALWDQGIKLLRLIVTMGDTIDEDIIPPLPEQFEKSEKKSSQKIKKLTGNFFAF